MKDTPQTPSRRDEWEERVTALLLGEVSQTEAREIERLMEGDAALRSFHDRMKGVVELVREVVPASPTARVAEETGPRLSAERRQGLLEHFKKTPAQQEPVQEEPAPTRWRFRLHWAIPVGLAATVVALLGWQLLREASPFRMVMYSKVTPLAGSSSRLEEEAPPAAAVTLGADHEVHLGFTAQELNGDQPAQQSDAPAIQGLGRDHYESRVAQSVPGEQLARKLARPQKDWAKYPGGPSSGPANGPRAAEQDRASLAKVPAVEGRSDLFVQRVEEATKAPAPDLSARSRRGGMAGGGERLAAEVRKYEPSGARTDGKSEAVVNEKLVPLPLELPMPAFVGTPADFSIAKGDKVAGLDAAGVEAKEGEPLAWFKKQSEQARVPQLGDVPLAGKAFFGEELRERGRNAFANGRGEDGVSEFGRAADLGSGAVALDTWDDSGAAARRWSYGGYRGFGGGAGGGGAGGGGFGGAAAAGQTPVPNDLRGVEAVAGGARHRVAFSPDGTQLVWSEESAGRAGGRYDANFFSGTTPSGGAYSANAAGYVNVPQETVGNNLIVSAPAGESAKLDQSLDFDRSQSLFDQGRGGRAGNLELVTEEARRASVAGAAPSKPAEPLAVADNLSSLTVNGPVTAASTGLPAVELQAEAESIPAGQVVTKGVDVNRIEALTTDEALKVQDLKRGVVVNGVRGKEGLSSSSARVPMSLADGRAAGVPAAEGAEPTVDRARRLSEDLGNLESVKPEVTERYKQLQAGDELRQKLQDKELAQEVPKLGVELRLTPTAEPKPQTRYGLVEMEGKKLRELSAVRTNAVASFGLRGQMGEVEFGGKEKAVTAPVPAAPATPAPPPAASAGGTVAVLVPSEPAAAQPAPVQPPPPEPKPEVLTAVNPISTFSLNVSDVAFKLAAASLGQGQLPAPASVRSEEFLNAFDYHDPAPAAGAKLALAWDQAQHPFAHNRDLLRFSIQTAAWGRELGRPLNLVLAVDNSGSMERADRVRILRAGLTVLARQLKPTDRVSVVAFARTPWLCVDGMAGGNPDQLLEQVLNLNPEGGTNLEEALGLAYGIAAKHFIPAGNNRVILMTDGAANLGNVDPVALRKVVERHRQQGIALDCFGVGWEGYNDDLLEVLARNGDGRYGFLNNPQEAATDFAGQLAGALRVAAADVKAQVEFNPQRVVSYRQIGYEKHQLTAAQFRDNTVDAAELGAAESGTALYAIEVNGDGTGPLGVVRVRYKVPGTGSYQEQEWLLPYNAAVQPLDRAYPSLRLAAVSALFAEWLARNPFAGGVGLPALQSHLRGVPEAFPLDERPRQLQAMLDQARRISGQ